MKDLNELLNESLVNESKDEYVDIVKDISDFLSINYLDTIENKEVSYDFDFKIRLFYNIIDDGDYKSFNPTDIKILTPRPKDLPKKYFDDLEESLADEWVTSFNLNDDFLNELKKKNKKLADELKETGFYEY